MVLPAYFENSVVPPVSAHDGVVVTAVPAAAVYATPKSKSASVSHAIAVSVSRYPGAAWCRDSCSALLAYCAGSTLVQNVWVPEVGESP